MVTNTSGVLYKSESAVRPQLFSIKVSYTSWIEGKVHACRFSQAVAERVLAEECTLPWSGMSCMHSVCRNGGMQMCLLLLAGCFALSSVQVSCWLLLGVQTQ